MTDAVAVLFGCPTCKVEPKGSCRDVETGAEIPNLIHDSRIAEVRRFEDSIVCRMWRAQITTKGQRE